MLPSKCILNKSEVTEKEIDFFSVGYVHDKEFCSTKKIIFFLQDLFAGKCFFGGSHIFLEELKT